MTRIDRDRASSVSPPPGLTDEVRADWEALGAPSAPDGVPADRRGALPQPVQRWLSHALQASAPPRTTVELRMHGRIRLGAWRRFTARQRLSAPGGFVWAATASLFGLPVVGFDRWTRGSGQMRWRLLDVVPVMQGRGDDITRSAAGRHAGELLLVAPGAALDQHVEWHAVDASRATARIQLLGATHEVTLTVAPDGSLTELVMTRWGAPDGPPFAYHPFGASLHEHATFEGITIPSRITAGWHYGTDRWADGQFIRYTVDDVRYR